MSKGTDWADDLSLSASGKKLVGKAGIVLVRRLSDKVGLTDALGAALVRRDFRPVHDRGTALVSAACAGPAGCAVDGRDRRDSPVSLVLGPLGVHAVASLGAIGLVPRKPIRVKTMTMWRTARPQCGAMP
ncbi:hypothetical protein ACH4TV_32360 [Streptomyces sp. NPDC020898]|uniref:hypothetical protein n=1 Tax=Streptomyces sp. NPDC020898 TaxID=3365101 RepID=UPI0037A55D70